MPMTSAGIIPSATTAGNTDGYAPCFHAAMPAAITSVSSRPRTAPSTIARSPFMHEHRRGDRALFQDGHDGHGRIFARAAHEVEAAGEPRDARGRHERGHPDQQAEPADTPA